MKKNISLLIPLLLVALLAACGPAVFIEEASPTSTAISETAVSTATVSTTDSVPIETTPTSSRGQAVSPIPIPATATPASLPTIRLPISIYIIDDVDGKFSSRRTVDELTAVYERVNEIWAQANIILDIQTIQRIELSGAPLQGILSGDFQPFFNSLGRNEIEVLQPSLLNGFYSQAIGGPNGIVPGNSRLFFVMDTPSVHDERVTSHEIGHILGLHHVPDDPDRLLFSGTNGMTLSPEEIVVVRYFAQGMLDRLR